MKLIKWIAEGFGEEEIILKEEINLRAYLNCYFTQLIAGIIWTIL